MCGKCLHCVGDVVRWYHIRSPTPTRLVWSCLFFLALISNTNYNSASVAQWHPQWTVTKHIPTWAVVSDCQPLVDSQASPALLALQASTLVPTYVLKVNWYKNIHFCCCCCVNSSGAGKECDWGGWEKLHKNILWTEEKKRKKKEEAHWIFVLAEWCSNCLANGQCHCVMGKALECSLMQQNGVPLLRLDRSASVSGANFALYMSQTFIQLAPSN